MHLLLLAIGVLGQVPTGELTIKTGDLQVTMSARAAWTITSVAYGPDKMILPLGGQGAAIATKEGGWIGSGMKADSEPVSSLAVTVDGKPIPLSPPLTVSGQKVTVTKQSKLAELAHTAETTFEKDRFIQHHTFEATGDLAVNQFYAFLYSLSPAAKQWLAQPLRGELLRGEFKADNGSKPNRPVRWIAQYDPAIGKGVVAYFREPFAGNGGLHNLWDTPGYHKLFGQPAKGTIAKGTKFDLTMVMQFFAATPAEWEQKTQQIVEAIQREVPPVPAPAVAESQSPRLYGPGVPEEGIVTLKTSKYTVPLRAEQAWTIQKIEYDGQTVAHQQGFYGTVLIPKGGKFVGTGHTEGGKEVVHALKLLVDGKEQPVKVDQTVTGGKLTLEKQSTIWKFKCLAEVSVSDEGIVERTRLEATEDLDLALLYYFMHCFVPSTTKWMAELPDGAVVEGPLPSAGGFQVNRDTRWVAEFEPAMKLGFLCYTPKVIQGPGSATKIWDLERYHKLYYQANAATSLKQGEKLDYSVIVKIVPEEGGDGAATKAAVEKLKKEYPPQ